jgi:hypothetical protein
MLYDEIGTTGVINRSTERRLKLLGNIEAVEDRYAAGISLYHPYPIRCYERDIVTNFLIDLVVVDIYILIGRIEKVAQQGYST